MALSIFTQLFISYWKLGQSSRYFNHVGLKTIIKNAIEAFITLMLRHFKNL